MLTVKWSDSGANTLVQDTLDKLQEDVDNFAISKGLKHDLVYLNYAGPKQNPLTSYGRSNLKFLKEVAKKYDPQGLFQTQLPGGFKLGSLEQF